MVWVPDMAASNEITGGMQGAHAGAWCRLVGAVSVLCFGAGLLLGCSQRTMEVTVLVPADRQQYADMIGGGSGEHWRAAAKLPFIRKKVFVPSSSDVILATAEAAARETPDQAGEGVRYLKIQDGTAYVLLPMDCDGWAGVSFARATSHPIVERTLLQFKSIKRVIWDVAPGEKLHDGGPAINQ